MKAHAFTPGERALLEKLGLLHEVAPGTFELTTRAHILLAKRPCAAEPVLAWLARLKVVSTILATLVIGCGAIVDDYLDDGDDQTTSVYLNPTDELMPHFEHAIQRWETAGVRRGTIRVVARGGTPAYRGELETQNGRTEIWRSGKGVDRIVIDGLTPNVFAHELGCHALTRTGDSIHLADGLCSSHVPANAPIDAASLELVCSHVTCDWFAPEESTDDAELSPSEVGQAVAIRGAEPELTKSEPE